MINKRYKEDALIFDIKNGGIYKSPLFYGTVDKIIDELLKELEIDKTLFFC